MGLVFTISNFFIDKISQANKLSAEKIPTYANLPLPDFFPFVKLSKNNRNPFILHHAKDDNSKIIKHKFLLLFYLYNVVNSSRWNLI